MAESRGTSIKAISIYVTCPDADCAHMIARALLSDRLIGCATMLPGATSLYQWDGEVAEDSECVMILKARADDFARIETAITALHPYDVPCILCWPIVAGSADYLAWLAGETSRQQKGAG